MNNTVYFKDLNLIDYKKCWDYQEQLFNEILAVKLLNKKENKSIKTNNFLLFCEHPHVYTLGKSGDKKHLLVNNNFLKSNQVSYYETNRGGDITYHGPGQIVVYPIFDLSNFFTDIGQYLRLLEEVVILTLKDYHLKGERSKGETGVWLGLGTKRARKICAIGVKTSRWVTMHGLAFNINTDLSYFNHIVPCGIVDKKVTSLKEETGKNICFTEVKNKIKNYFSLLFDVSIV